jgi:hypothetical protein
LRRAIKTGEAAIISAGDVHKNVASGGRSIDADAVWHLPVAELAEAPQLGDVIVDGQQQRWTICLVKRATLGARWRCETRNVAIAFGLDDTIAVLKTADGQNWVTWKTGIRARIQSIDAKIVAGAETPYTTKHYRVFVEETLELDHTCRLRGADGAIYIVTRVIGGDRIGELQTIEAEINVSG